MKKFSDVFKSIRFAKMDPKHDKPEIGGSKDDEEHYTVGEKEWEQQVKHVKKRAMQEEKKDGYDEGEYDREGDMAKSDLRSIMANAKRLHDMIDDADNLPEWVQSKITVAEDYISTVANYMTAEMNESVADKLAQRHSDLRKKSGLPHPDYYKELGKSYDINDDKERLAKQSEIKKKYKVESYVPSPHAKPVPKKPKGEYERKVDKYLKKKYNKEEVEHLEEMPGANMDTRAVHKHLRKQGWSLSRTSGGHDVFTHPKAKDHIAVPRHKQLKAPLVRGILKASKVNEDVEQINEIGDTNKGQKLLRMVNKRAVDRLVSKKADKDPAYAKKAQQTHLAADERLKEEHELSEGRPSQRHPLEGHEYHKKSNEELIGIAKDAHKAAEAMKSHNTTAENKYRDQANDSATVRYFRQKNGMPDWYKKKYGHVKEEIEQLDEKNVPTNPSLWSKAKSLARSKFDVYPSAYANGWASKWYKSKGGGWKSVSEEVVNESRKTEIIKKIAKKKPSSVDKFEPNPVMVKTRDDRDH